MSRKKRRQPQAPTRGARVIGYLRHSSVNQERSVPQQRAELEKQAAAEGWQLVAVFADEGKSGTTTEGREDFLAMIDRCLDDPASVDACVIWEYSRWAREEHDFAYYMAMLERVGIAVVSMKDPIPDGPASGIVKAAYAFAAAEESRNISRRVKRGQASLVEQGFPTGGRPPLGYLSERIEIPGAQGREARLHCRWTPDPAQQAAIMRAFEMRAGGYTIKAIHDELHLYSTKSGYAAMFVNPTYKGSLSYGELEYRGRVEALVDADTWQRAQVKGLRRGKVSGNYLLSGLLRCGHCGKALTGKHVTSNVKGKLYAYKYYACAQQDRTWGEGCHAGMIPVTELDALVLADLRAQLLNVDVILAAVDVLRRLEAEQGQPDVDRLQGKVEHLRRLLARQQQLAADPDFDVEAARLRTRELRAELGQVEAQIGARRGVQLAGFDADYVRAWVLRMTDVLEGSDMPERKRLLRRLIAEIRVDWPGVTVSFRPLEDILAGE